MDLPQYFQTGHGANMIDFSFEPFGRLGLFRTKRECCLAGTVVVMIRLWSCAGLEGAGIFSSLSGLDERSFHQRAL